jgi:3-methyladenine DNA glycosylase AlkD
MATASTILADLKKRGTAQAIKIYTRHGNDPSRVMGVSFADLNAIAKKLKGEQDLGCALYDSGIMEAMYLGGMILDGSAVSKKQLDQWAAACDGLTTIAESSLPDVAARSRYARELALKWMKSKKESVASLGWRTYAAMIGTTPDDELELAEIEGLLKIVEKSVHTAANRVRYTMNGFVISVGSYVKPLHKQAMATAKAIGAVKVKMGETACKVPLATEYIEKAVKAGKAGVKRK